MRTASAKEKGRKLQQLVRDMVIDMLKPCGIVAEDVKSAPMGVNGEDIQLSPFAKNFLPVSYECKARKGLAIYNMYAQAENYEGEPVLVVKANHKKPLAVIDLNYYMELEKCRIQLEKIQ